MRAQLKISQICGRITPSNQRWGKILEEAFCQHCGKQQELYSEVEAGTEQDKRYILKNFFCKECDSFVKSERISEE